MNRNSLLIRCMSSINASPMTIIGLIYVLLFQLFGWYRFVGYRHGIPTWTPCMGTAPCFIRKPWKNWGGHTIGEVIVLRDLHDAQVIVHEVHHVKQYRKLGVLFLPLYLLGMFIAFCVGEHSYFMNPFEIAARRAAKQDIDQ